MVGGGGGRGRCHLMLWLREGGVRKKGRERKTEKKDKCLHVGHSCIA